jgi:3-methyladenine DNA glycosylase AlkD
MLKNKLILKNFYSKAIGWALREYAKSNPS